MTTDPTNPDPRPQGRMSVLDQQECWELLSTTTVGRVAFVSDRGVEVFPMNFTVIDRAVYLRTAIGTVPAQLGDGIADVAFEVDHHGEFSRDGWDVTVKGSAARVEDPDLVKRVGADPRLRPWAGGERTQVIELTVHSIDGRRVHSH